MKWSIPITSILAFGLMVTSVFAAEETSWGQLKEAASQDITAVDSPDPALDTVSFSFWDLMPAAKIAADSDDAAYDKSQRWLDKNRSKTKKIGRRGGKIVVGHKTLNHGRYTLRAEFNIPKGALKKRVPITATLIGDRLENLIVEFAPAGLEFASMAKLTLKVGRKRAPANLDGVEVEHIYENGHVEKAAWRSSFRLRIC
jgi:hypothetical protein